MEITRYYVVNGKNKFQIRVVVSVIVMHLQRAKCNAVISEKTLKQQFREHFLHIRSYALNGKCSRNRVVVLVVAMHL